MKEDQRTAGRQSHEEPPSAATAAALVLSRLADLARTTMATQASLAKQSVDLTWATLAGNMDRTNASKAYVASVTREGARYWREVGELGVDYATDLATLGKSVTSTVLREVAAVGRKPGTRQASRTNQGSTDSTGHNGERAGSDAQQTYEWSSDGPSTAGPDHDGSGRLVELTLRGPVGGRAEGAVTVANRHPRPRRIQLSAGDVVNTAGDVVGAALDISPTTVTVPSGQERSVSLGIDLVDASFLAGQRYAATVLVSGGDEATIEVSIEVRS